MVRAYRGFCSVKHAQEYCYFPPWMDAIPSQGYPPAVCRRYPFIHLGEDSQSGLEFVV